MEKNVLLETLEYIINDLKHRGGTAIGNNLILDNKLNVPYILYFISQYMVMELIEHNEQEYNFYYSEEDGKRYPFVSCDKSNVKITQRCELWLDFKQGKYLSQDEYENSILTIKRQFYAYLLKECYYLYDAEPSTYVPINFYKGALEILFLTIPGVFDIFLDHFDDDDMESYNQVMKDVVRFSVSYNDLTRDDFESKVLNDNICLTISGAIKHYLKAEFEETQMYKRAISVLKCQIGNFYSYLRNSKNQNKSKLGVSFN